MTEFERTPVQALKDTDEGRNRFFMKRDDLLPFSFGGNKVRIASEFLKDMRAEKCDAMIFYGDRRSNLCRVLSALCMREGIPSLMIATEENPGNGPEPFNSRLIGMTETKVLKCRKDGIAEAVDRAFDEMKRIGRKPYYIYGSRLGTGREGIAARAYAGAYGEIEEAEKSMGISFDCIFTPYGTGATQGGLIAGCLERGIKRKIVGISISSRSRERAMDILAKTVQDYFLKNGKETPPDIARSLELHTEYNCGGYGIHTDEVREMIARLMRTDAVPLDPTYTGKAYLGMKKYLRENGIADSNVLFLHTGGLPLYFDYLTEGK